MGNLCNKIYIYFNKNDDKNDDKKEVEISEQNITQPIIYIEDNIDILQKNIQIKNNYDYEEL